jgi:hypothetical protein
MSFYSNMRTFPPKILIFSSNPDGAAVIIFIPDDFYIKVNNSL